MRVLRTTAIASTVVAVLVGAASFAAAPRTSKTRLSKSGALGVRLTELGEGKCRLEVVKDSTPLWQLEQCVGTVDDLYFVSDDGAKVWVVVTLPKKPTKRPKKARKPVWTYAVVAAEYGRDGKVVSARRLNDLLRSKAALEEVRQFEKHFKWLEGVAGENGIPPKLNDAGQIELHTLDHKQHRLAF